MIKLYSDLILNYLSIMNIPIKLHAVSIKSLIN